MVQRIKLFSTPVLEEPEPQVGNRCHSSPTTETTGYELELHRAFGSPQRYRLR
jgi:hypothetical protein